VFYVHDDIIDLIESGRVKFYPTSEAFPFSFEDQIGPGSIDLRLGFSFLRFKENISFDLNTSDDTISFDLKSEDNLILKPNEIILANTLESVFLPSDIGAIITGRSSLSRIGLQINISQDFVQPGYANPIPLQLVNLHSDKTITLPVNIRICQLILFDASSKTSKPYSVDIYSKYGKEGVKPEPSKLGIEYGKNTEADFLEDDVSVGAQILIKQWRDQLEAESRDTSGKKYKNSESEIGKFISDFIASPNISRSTNRTSFREDSIYTELRNLFSGGAERVRVLDVCCGYSSWIDHIDTIQENASKIEFVGVDMNDECIKYLESNSNKLKFLSFNCFVRKATDLKGLVNDGKFNLICFTNSLHEIDPSLYYNILSSMNSVVNEKDGKIIITDMEKLPENESESIAINWSKDEIKKILESGGFQPEITQHRKEVNVFQAVIKYTKSTNEEKMLKTIKQLLINKRKTTIHFIENLEANPIITNSYKKQWLKGIALIARISISIKRINEK